MKEFTFQIVGFERDEYCYGLVDRYGEESEIVKMLDENYEKLIATSHVYVEQLNAIRKFLYESGFEEEAKRQDEIFLEQVKKRKIKR